MTGVNRRLFWVGLAVCAALGAGGWLAVRVDPAELDPERIRGWGWPAAAGYAVAMAVLGGFGLPPVVLLVPAGMVWPFWVAFLQAYAGGMGAAVIGFLGSRYALRSVVTPRIPPRLLAFERRLETHALGTVVGMRLLFYLFPPVNWMLGISRIPLGVFVVGTAAGMLPGTVMYLLAGKGLLGLLLERPLAGGLAVLAGVAGLAAWGWGRGRG